MKVCSMISALMLNGVWWNAYTILLVSPCIPSQNSPFIHQAEARSTNFDCDGNRCGILQSFVSEMA
jgi:hypothetical protein